MNGIIHVNLKTGAREVRNIARRPNFDFRQVETLKHDNLEEAQKKKSYGDVISQLKPKITHPPRGLAFPQTFILAHLLTRINRASRGRAGLGGHRFWCE